MTTERIQSDINETRDQLSLDFADSEYLNVVSRNLGMDRPILGFTDDSWRAVVKILALEYKQIANKFREVLAIIFGPRVTEVGTLAESVEVGDAEFVMNETSNLPQLGTLIFDEGLVTEETLDYCYIDRVTNTVFLETNFGAAHIARDFDSEEPIILVEGTKVVCRKTNNFPITDYPYPVVLGRGTDNEEVVLVVDNNLITGTLTLSVAPTNTHDGVTVSNVSDELNQPYFPLSSFLQVEDSSKFPSEGYIRLRVSGDATDTDFVLTANTPAAADDFVLLAADTFVAATQQVTDMVFANSAGSSTDIQSAGGSLPSFVVGDRFEVHDHASNNGLYEVTAVTTENEDYTVTGLDVTPIDAVADPSEISYDGEIVGYEVVFTGNVTSALAGVTRRITSGTDSYLSFDDDFTGPAAAPATGDEFTLYPIVQYTSLDYDSNTFTLRAPILETNITIPQNAVVELMQVEETAAFCPVKFGGAGWDVIQSTPRLVELLIPAEIRDPQDLRSSSHMHEDRLGTTSVVSTSDVTPASTSVAAASFSAFPDAGTLEFDPGGGTADRVPYGKQVSFVSVYAAIGSGTITLDDSREFPATGNLIVDEGADTEETLAFTANNTVSGVITLSGTTSFEHRVGDVVKCDTEVTFQAEPPTTWLTGTTVELYQPKYGSTDVPIGDFQQTQDTFPGPYIYSLDERAATATVALTNAATLVPGTTTVSLEQGVDKFALEVTDALPMLSWSGGGLFDAVIGTGTFNQETVTVQSIGIKGRAATTIAVTDPIIGSTTIEVASLTPGAASDGATFPTDGGYRIVIAEGTANEEVAYVTGTLSGPDRFVLESGLTINQALGATVDLLSDVVETTVLTEAHFGFVDYTNRSTAVGGADAYARPISQTNPPALVQPLIGSITLASTTGLDIDGGNVIFNFGNGKLPVESALDAALTGGVSTTVSVDTSDEFPAPTSLFVAIIGEGTPKEERVLVSANNTGTDVLTLEGGFTVQYDHAIGEIVRFEPGEQEDIAYSEVDGSTLRFSPEIVLQYTHYPDETVVDSSATSDPKTNGYDFPLRMPGDIITRLQYLLDIIRAAGVQVELIEQR